MSRLKKEYNDVFVNDKNMLYRCHLSFYYFCNNLSMIGVLPTNFFLTQKYKNHIDNPNNIKSFGLNIRRYHCHLADFINFIN